MTVRSCEDRSTRKSFDTFTPLGPLRQSGTRRGGPPADPAEPHGRGIRTARLPDRPGRGHQRATSRRATRLRTEAGHRNPPQNRVVGRRVTQ
ncbi:hypothetical protein ABTZ21_11080 [Streptomyces sp. NPDC096191]|uniref:hypothetical protein n=1 Tax=Streptomyces sp. NPDC096191 TaxID=3155426 RepID=UPI003327109D